MNYHSKMRSILSLPEIIIRRGTRATAVVLHRVSRGHIHPNDITLTALVMHLPIAALIATNHLAWAAVLLAVFSLLDTLDGELARLQHTVSDVGGLLDAVSTRIKELCMYAGVLYLFSSAGLADYYLLAVMVACGASLIIPYINAKAEAIVTTYGHELSYNRLNRMFTRGLLPYEVRVSAVIVGLLFGITSLSWIMLVLAVLATFTMLQSLISIVWGLYQR